MCSSKKPTTAIKNYRRSGQGKDNNVLYSIMLQSKLTEGSEKFVRDIKIAPEPICVLFMDWQMDDMVRFLTNHRNFSILTVQWTPHTT